MSDLHREAGDWSPHIVLPVMLGFSAGPELPDLIRRSMRHPGVCSDTTHFSDVKPGKKKKKPLGCSLPFLFLHLVRVLGQINKLKLKLELW